MITSVQSFLVSCLILYKSVLSIEVAPNSPCSTQCVDNSNSDTANPASSTTQTWNLHCQDWELSGSNSTSDGRKWESCLSCESKSAFFDPTTGESDVMWFLFNMRFTLDWCIFGYQNNNPNGTPAMSECSNVCSGQGTAMQSALTTLLHTNTSTQYDYCDENDAAFTDNVDGCIQCIATVPSSTILANYLRALDQACEQRPLPGSKAISMNSPLFPNTTNTSSISNSSASSHPTPSISNSKRLEIGLAVGLGCAFFFALLFGTLFFLHKRRTANVTSNSNNNNRAGSYAESGTSWFSSPITAPPYIQNLGGSGQSAAHPLPPPLYPVQYPPPPQTQQRVYHEAMSKEISGPRVMGTGMPMHYVFPPDYVSPVEVGGGLTEGEREREFKGLNTGGRNGNWI